MHPEPLTTVAEIEALSRKLSAESLIAVDTEFVRENTFFPIVELIQVATREESWIIDVQPFKKGHRPGVSPEGRASYEPGIEPFLEILRSPDIIKILHASPGDQECFYTSFGVVASPIFDTSIAASLCGMGESIGLSKLLDLILNVEIKKGHARTNWSVRPLPAQLLEYAHADVTHLVSLGEVLMQELEKRGRKPWAFTLSAQAFDPAGHHLDIESSSRRIARSSKLDREGYAALLELLQWREKRVRELNLPRRWVADDSVLVDLARVKPKDLKHLGAFRGLNKGEIRDQGEKILSALRTAHENAAKLDFSREKTAIPSPNAAEAQAVELLKCFLGLLAEEHEIGLRHLLTAPQMLQLIRTRQPSLSSLEAWVKKAILSQHSAQLVGEELIEFLQGKRFLCVDQGRVKIRSHSAEERSPS